ncbi:MAG TPA: biotin--[acetyl-CoA-carboxylase] ligase [Clostridiales bacterium]|nr:biotin--[acetyl-CoA-carboxylase] ligase [Clostridiales bacterium]HPV01373.1 biotin--[acetyl-CoA-carboxylase] ligase [Clostridiales bacterium]
MRYEILKLLKEAGSDYVTGVDIGTRFGISRSAVWKHINELRSEGYEIESAPNLGYRLLSGSGRLNPFEIMNGLGTRTAGCEVVWFDEITSTNTHAAKLAAEGCSEGMTVVAGMQTHGKGRLGRSWESPGGKGIYLSVVLRPPMAPPETPVLTLAAAVATVRAIYAATGIRTGIKWPNDIIFNGRKISGILLEMNSEADRVNYIILGIGINYSQTEEDFPPELRDRAVSVLSASGGRIPGRAEPDGRENGPGGPENTPGARKNTQYAQKNSYDGDAGRLSLIRTLLREIDNIYHDILSGKTGEILDEWRRFSVTLGKEVRFSLRNAEYTGKAVDITENGSLLVDCSDGVRRELLSGEISVRGIFGYAG